LSATGGFYPKRIPDYLICAQNLCMVEPKPHSCDFNDVPLGNKYCYCERSEEVTRACPAPDSLARTASGIAEVRTVSELEAAATTQANGTGT
jgi:hypothetical protein